MPQPPGQWQEATSRLPGSSPLVANGLPNFTIVGLTDRAIQEARERVRASIRNAGFEFPARRLTVNLAPAEIPEGPASISRPPSHCMEVADLTLGAPPPEFRCLFKSRAHSGASRRAPTVGPRGPRCRQHE